MNCLPDYFKIYLEIAMGQCIAHFVGNPPWHLWMFLCELRVMKINISACLADDLEISDHGILGLGIFKKLHLGHVLDLKVNSSDCFQNVSQIFRHTQLACFAHTSSASDSICSRQLSGRALGVNTSTGMPSN